MLSGTHTPFTRRNAASSEDFGYGWRLEFRNTDLHTRVPKTGDEADLIYNPFQNGTRVYLTLPGGQRESFTFHPTFRLRT